jgi:hypothetical protein
LIGREAHLLKLLHYLLGGHPRVKHLLDDLCRIGLAAQSIASWRSRTAWRRWSRTAGRRWSRTAWRRWSRSHRGSPAWRSPAWRSRTTRGRRRREGELVQNVIEKGVV